MAPSILFLLPTQATSELVFGLSKIAEFILKRAHICLASAQSGEESHLTHVILRDGEDPEGLLKRFQTSMQRSGILRELRNRRFFRTKGEQERLDKARSLRRMRRRRNR
ncbi:MAG: 30S ribosomal protein S21 [Chloroflexi bacterium]|nr:30S ribosomal protein S21 [Chloroflexota bacterium]